MPITPPSNEEPGLPTVTREKERVIAPPRSAVPAPGASPFGRGFFRRLRDSGMGAFLIVFLSVGAAIFLFGLAGTVGPYKEGLRENGDPRFFLGAMAFGTVFCLVTLRILQVALADAGNKRTKEKGRKSEPWTWDYPWREEWMPPDYTGTGSGTVLGRLAFLALLGMFNVAWWSPSWLFKGIVALFDLFGLLILYDSFQKLYQWMRFRRPVVIWETLPAFLDSPLSGRVAFARGVRAAGPPRLTLRCVRDEWVTTGSGKNRRTQLEPQAIYRQTIDIPLPGPPGEPLDGIDFVFDVPSDQPGTDLSQSEAAVYWQVLVNVPLPGPNFETVFLAPVYQKR